jgi:hypothetical protein
VSRERERPDGRIVIAVLGLAIGLIVAAHDESGLQHRVDQQQSQLEYQQRQIDRIDQCMSAAVTPYGQQMQIAAGCKP